MNNKTNWVNLTIAILVALYMTYYAFTVTGWHFIDNVNLIIHEAGHFVFGFFGQFIAILGGSLMQILLPSIFAGYFFVHDDYFSSSLLLYWVGQNFLNVSVYAGDSVAMALPLLGGDGSIHDWNYLLTHIHLLPYTHQVSFVLFAVGILFLIMGTIGTIRFSLYPKNQ